MLYLLNPRVWIAIALVAGLAFTHWTAYRKGAANVRMQWDAAKAIATQEARKLEQARQRGVDAAAKLAAARDASDRADAARARAESRGLRDDLSAVRLHASQSLASSNEAIRTLGELFEQCSEAHTELAREADAARTEALELRMAWPK